MKIFEDFLEKVKGLPEGIGKSTSDLWKSPMVIVTIIIVLIILIGTTRKIKFTTKMLVQMAIVLALSLVLDMLVVYRMPQGGSITIGSMVPLFLIAFAYGPSIGLLTGFLFGTLNLLLGGYVLTPVQVLLDYPIPFMVLGIAGYFKRNKNVGIILAVVFRLVFHFISGIVFFAEYTPEGFAPATWSLVYNGSFLAVELFICLLLINVLPVNRLVKTMNPSAGEIR